MKVSVITCVKSDTEDLKDTWQSIRPFINGDLQWIVKFGSECSDQFIKSIPNQPEILKIKTPDKSLYDGLNQALQRCETELYFVLGAGDKVSENFRDAINEILSNPEYSAYFFACSLMKTNTILQPELNEINIRMACPHPGSILRTKISKEIDGYEATYQIASDYDHLCRYLSIYKDAYQSTTIISEFMGDGISEHRAFEGMLEEELIRIRIYKSNPFAVYGRLFRVVSTPIVSLLSANFK